VICEVSPEEGFRLDAVPLGSLCNGSTWFIGSVRRPAHMQESILLGMSVHLNQASVRVC
jgi:hypothetical protein